MVGKAECTGVVLNLLDIIVASRENGTLESLGVEDIKQRI